MSESIRWKTLTPEQRDALVAENVMRWEPKECDGYISWDHGIWRCLECGKDGTRHEDTTHNIPMPRYTQSMDAAWKVLLYTAFNSRAGVSDLAVLAHEVFMTSTVEPHDIDPIFTLGIVSGWTPEFLCIASLRACGYEVIYERS